MKQIILFAICIGLLGATTSKSYGQCPDGSLPATFAFSTCCVAEVVNTVNYVVYNELEEVETQGTISLSGLPGAIQYELCLPEGCYYTTFSYSAGFATAQHLESFAVVGDNTSSFNIFQTSQNIPFSFGFCVTSTSINCQASFTPTVQQNGVLTVDNTSIAVDGFTSLYGWDYGDGSNTQGLEPSHTYTANGIYEVCLFRALYDGDIPVCVSDTCITIEMNTVPDNSGCPTEIVVTDGELCGHYTLAHNGLESGVNYWFVDDALEATTTELELAFDNVGTHQICLAHASPTCESSTTLCVTINVPDCSNSNCAESIQVEPAGCHGYFFHVNNMGAFGNMVWNFGDGTTLGGQNNVTHVFDSLGVYEVCVEAWNAYCQDGITLCTTIEVGPCGGVGNSDCTGELYHTYESDCGHVHFEGGLNASNAPVIWNFGDGPSITSTSTVIDHYFESPGVYTVTALIANEACPNNITLYAVVTIEDCFEIIDCPTSMYTGATNNCSTWNFEVGSLTPGESVIWTYGDGSTSIGGHFSNHTYATNGTYQVCAQYSSDYCPQGVELCETITVNCSEPCSLSIQQVPTACGLAVLQATTNVPNAQVQWSIGGMNTGMTGNIVTFELADGVYPVCAWYISENCDQAVEVCDEITINNCNACTELSFGFDSYIAEGGTSFLSWNLYHADDMQNVASGMAQYSVNDPYYDHVECLADGCYILTALTNTPFDFNAVSPIIGNQAEIISMDAVSTQGSYGYEILLSINGDCTVDCDVAGFNFTSYPSYGGMAAVEWVLRNSSNALVASGGYNFTNEEVAQYYYDCLPEDCYTLVFFGNQPFESNSNFTQMISGFWSIESIAYGTDGNLFTMEIHLNLNSNCQEVNCTLELSAVEVEQGWFEFTATGNPEVYPMLWDFGDGETLEATWVTMHEYPLPGAYTVCALIQTDACGILEACTTIVIEGENPCDYSIWTGPGQTCGDIIFEIAGGSALGPIVWNFGDEIVTDNQSIIHHFDEAGVYTVYATASTETCPNIELAVEVVVPECTTCTPAAFLFVSDVASGGTNCVAISLTNTQTNETINEVLEFTENIMTHEWNQCLADGCYSLTFDSCLPIEAGNGLSYDVFVNGESILNDVLVTNQDNYSMTMAFGINSTCFDGTCEAYFEYETTDIPGQIILNNLSYTGGGEANYTWNLGNGYETTGDINSFVYLQNGTYEVCLNMNTSLCSNTYCETITIDNTDCNETGALITLTSDFPMQNMSEVLNILVSVEDGAVAEFIQEVTPFNTYTLPVCLPDGCYILDLVSNAPLEALGIFAVITSNNIQIGEAEILNGSFYGGNQFGINNDCTDSVNEADIALLDVYPNPATDLLQWTIPPHVRVQSIALYNSLGQAIGTIQPNERSVNTTSLPWGVYFLRFTTNEGIINHKIQIAR